MYFNVYFNATENNKAVQIICRYCSLKLPKNFNVKFFTFLNN